MYALGVPLSALLAFSTTVAAQDYPAGKPIRILTSQPGSGSDVIARILLDKFPETLGQRGVVDNRGILAPELAAKSPPDGYTVLFYSTPLWVNPMMQTKAHWDTLKDFVPVTLAVNAPNILVVHPSLPVKSVQELLVLAKKRPGELNYGSGSSGSSSHLASELFNAMAGINITRIPYRGVGPAMLGLLSGQVQVLIPSASAAMPHARSGRVRMLAVTSAKPSTLLPELPTLSASGVKDYESDTPLGVFMPAGTPPAILNQFYKSLVTALNQPDTRKLVLAQASEVVASTPADFSTWLRADIARWSKLIREKNLRDEN